MKIEDYLEANQRPLVWSDRLSPHDKLLYEIMLHPQMLGIPKDVRRYSQVRLKRKMNTGQLGELDLGLINDYYLFLVEGKHVLIMDRHRRHLANRQVIRAYDFFSKFQDANELEFIGIVAFEQHNDRVRHYNPERLKGKELVRAEYPPRILVA